jgi:hypothetical protein
MNLLIEPPNTDSVDKFVVTPLTTYVDFIKYLDNHINIYKKGYYRLFFDFTRTYILSNKGIATYAKGEMKYPVVINIRNNFNAESKVQGLNVDTTQQRYLVDVDEIDTTFDRNTATTTLYNNVIGINNSGETYVETLDSDRSSAVNKTTIQRTKNLSNVTSLTASIKNKERIINIVKNNLDSSIFTINREYIITHYKETEYNGNYLLIRKREVLLKEADNFIMSNILTFSKVNS